MDNLGSPRLQCVNLMLIRGLMSRNDQICLPCNCNPLRLFFGVFVDSDRMFWKMLWNVMKRYNIPWTNISMLENWWVFFYQRLSLLFWWRKTFSEFCVSNELANMTEDFQNVVNYMTVYKIFCKVTVMSWKWKWLVQKMSFTQWRERSVVP